MDNLDQQINQVYQKMRISPEDKDLGIQLAKLMMQLFDAKQVVRKSGRSFGKLLTIDNLAKNE